MNKFDKPWIKPGLKISRLEKFKLLDAAKISKDPLDYEKYKKFSNKYTYLKNLAIGKTITLNELPSTAKMRVKLGNL